MKKWYRFKMDALDAVDTLFMKLLDAVCASRKKAYRRWSELGGASEG